MKQKKINDILYVFDFTPYEITQDTDAAVIKVQEESYAGFIALNESLADKIVKYNYNMMTVQPLEWAPYIDSKEYELTINGWNWVESITVTIDGEPQEVHDSYELYEGAVIEIAPVDGNSIYDYYVGINGQYVAPEDDKWTFTMESPEGIAVTVGYGEPKTLYFDATNITSSNLGVNSYGHDLGIQSEYTMRCGQNTLISFVPTEGSEDYTASDNMIWNADQACWEVNYYNIEDGDTVSLEYNGQPVIPTITVTAPYDLAIYDEEWGSWVHMDQDQSDPSLEIGEITPDKAYSVEQRYGIGQGMDVTFSPACGTGQQGAVGAAFVAPDEDLTITLSQPVPQGHTLTLEGQDIHANVTVKFDNVTVQTDYQYVDVAENTVIDIYPTDNAANYDLIDGATWDTDHWTATMPDQDLTIQIDYIEPVQASPTVKVQYDVNNDTEPLTIFTWPDQSFDSNVPDQMFVDGAEETVSNTYQFDSTGTHTIEYVFNDGCFDIGLTGIDPDFTDIFVTSVEVNDAITSVADYAWGVKGHQPGASEESPLPLTYLPIVPPTINSTGASNPEQPGATVYVPADSVTDYQQASVWSDIAQLIQAIVPESEPEAGEQGAQGPQGNPEPEAGEQGEQGTQGNPEPEPEQVPE